MTSPRQKSFTSDSRIEDEDLYVIADALQQVLEQLSANMHRLQLLQIIRRQLLR